ncbi:MAG: precorrin-8X methylmutase [Pseudomonadota bacterium]
MMAYDYLQDPVAIESRSFELIRENTELGDFDEQQSQVAMRVVHTCGEPEVAQQLRFTEGAVEAGLRALEKGKPILCDVEMIVHGISRRYVESQVQCHLNSFGVAQKAKTTGQTRSMVALDYWGDHLEDSIAVIGNAPTALFRLLEMIQLGVPKPALVIGVPVGFVGAAESKELLWDECELLQLNVITLLGRKGGSAVASAVINALGRMHNGVFF